MAPSTALIIGASRGIGAAIAARLVSDGARVVMTAPARDLAELEDRVSELGRDRASFIVGRSEDPMHRASAVCVALERLGSLDALVISAGTNTHHGELMEAPLEAVERIMAVNVVAPLGWVQEVWQQWMAEHGGSVVIISSINAERNVEGLGLYCSSKAALTHLTRQLALELSPRVRVNALEPGVVRTRLARALYEGREAELSSVYPLGRLGEPTDIAGAAAFLLGSDACWITGVALPVDGGVLLVEPE